MERIEADSESQEEVIQNIARHLAQVGDEMDRSIQPGLVNDLVAHFMNVRLSEEDRRNCLATALKAAMQTYPKDMENEKATLIMTMLLAKKVADHTPSLLRDVFHATVNFINQNLFTYVRDLVRNVRITDASSLPFRGAPWSLSAVHTLLPQRSRTQAEPSAMGSSLSPPHPSLPDDKSTRKAVTRHAVRREAKPSSHHGQNHSSMVQTWKA
ncbi:BH3-interacting domain death agonist [Sciurus carolinensis]|uniref:BH3-interacting domain death agonist n=1 Tax=Sciurus carolinensis TaxID=30640 RepID=A0AA41NCC8_SCICA|nr:BH3-interacting domain death agonist [Sciurus carolinensis]